VIFKIMFRQVLLNTLRNNAHVRAKVRCKRS
jgi:hypothetical protein